MNNFFDDFENKLDKELLETVRLIIRQNFGHLEIEDLLFVIYCIEELIKEKEGNNNISQKLFYNA